MFSCGYLYVDLWENLSTFVNVLFLIYSAMCPYCFKNVKNEIKERMLRNNFFFLLGLQKKMQTPAKEIRIIKLQMNNLLLPQTGKAKAPNMEVKEVLF